MSRLGGWVRWIGCAAVWEAGRAVCGERHLQQTQAYSPTATEDDGVGRGDIHTYAIKMTAEKWKCCSGTRHVAQHHLTGTLHWARPVQQVHYSHTPPAFGGFTYE